MDRSTRILLAPVITATALTPFLARADEFDDSRNRFQVGGRAGLNLRVEFRNTAVSLAGTSGAGTGGATDRNYLDGFVRTDAGGNPGGTTVNWGYDHADQVSGTGTAVAFHDYSGNPWGGTTKIDDDPQWGAEIGYARIFGEWAGARWGLETGFNWLNLDIRDRGSLDGSVTQIIDTYGLASGAMPTAPYTGSATATGPALNDAPARLTATAPTRVVGSRELSADLFGFKLGPVIEIPLGDWLSAQLSGGLAVGWLDGKLSYNETATVPGGPTWTQAGSSSGDEWAIGGYARGQMTVRLTPKTGIYAAAEYQGMENIEIQAPGHTAELDLGTTYFFSLGLTVHF